LLRREKRRGREEYLAERESVIDRSRTAFGGLARTSRHGGQSQFPLCGICTFKDGNRLANRQGLTA
jgi:hypothetical protein